MSVDCCAAYSLHGARGGTRTRTAFRPLPPQGSASTNSATRAFIRSHLPFASTIDWCPGRDSNPHPFRDRFLRPARLPIPPPGPFCLCLRHNWSEQRDSNPRHPAPKAGALPGCAMLRKNGSLFYVWSVWPDSNRRPSVPQTDALPGCATHRCSCRRTLSGAFIVLVGETGFEPATPTSRTWCSTRLSYSPMRFSYKPLFLFKWSE